MQYYMYLALLLILSPAFFIIFKILLRRILKKDIFLDFKLKNTKCNQCGNNFDLKKGCYTWAPCKGTKCDQILFKDGSGQTNS